MKLQLAVLMGNLGDVPGSAEAAYLLNHRPWPTQWICSTVFVCYFADCLHSTGIDLRRPDEVLKLLPESCAITDCKRVYGALEKNESLGLGLSEKKSGLQLRLLLPGNT